MTLYAINNQLCFFALDTFLDKILYVVKSVAFFEHCWEIEWEKNSVIKCGGWLTGTGNNTSATHAGYPYSRVSHPNTIILFQQSVIVIVIVIGITSQPRVTNWNEPFFPIANFWCDAAVVPSYENLSLWPVDKSENYQTIKSFSTSSFHPDKTEFQRQHQNTSSSYL